MPIRKREPQAGEMLCPYDGVVYSNVPGYESARGCPVCKGIGPYHVPVPIIGEDWTERPRDGQLIEAFSVPLNKWLPAIYFDGGIDGLLQWEHAEDDWCELEEYGAEVITRWRPRKQQEVR